MTTYEEARRRFEERLKQPIPRAKPKLIAVEASAPMVAAIKANPQSLRMSASATNGTTVFERPYRSSDIVTVVADRVSEVDAGGRPIWDRGGVVSDYDIFAVLRRD